MKLYFIRHGKTAANEARLYCGSTDLPLTQTDLEPLPIDTTGCKFYTSGMKRTEQTLLALFGDVPHGVEPDFREMDFGLFEMKSYEQLKDDPQYQAWLTGDNEANLTPGGESGVQMQRRVIHALHRLLDAGEDAVVVTHGGVIAAVMAHLYPEEGRNRYQWQPRPGAGYCITENGWTPVP